MGPFQVQIGFTEWDTRTAKSFLKSHLQKPSPRLYAELDSYSLGLFVWIFSWRAPHSSFPFLTLKFRAFNSTQITRLIFLEYLLQDYTV